MTQVNGRDRAAEFVSPPPGVEWPPATGPAAQTGVDVEDEDVDWAALGVEEEAAARAAGKRSDHEEAEEEVSDHPAH